MLKMQLRQFLTANPVFEVTRDDAARTASAYFYSKFAEWAKSKGSKAPSIQVVGRALRGCGFSFSCCGYPKQQRAIVGLRNESADYKAYLRAMNERHARRILEG